MVLFRARSIRQLTVAGFLAVAAMLVLALLVTARELDLQTALGQTAVAEVATAMSSSRQLVEQTRAMERNALQYLVLRDESLLDVYRTRRGEFRSAAAQLRMLETGSDMAGLTDSLLETETAAFDLLTGNAESSRVETAYASLSRNAFDLSYAIELWISQQQTLLRERSEATRHSLTLQALMFIGAASGLAALFIVLITRPLSQIDQAIHRLGAGAYDKPVTVTGPLDLQALGRRLDWLRIRLTDLEQHRTSFLRHISHELKTPLAAMQEGASLLHEDVVGPMNDEQREVSRIIISNCQRLQSLIEDMLRHNSRHFDVLNTMPEAVHFDQVVESVVAAHHWPITSNRLRVHREMDKLTVTTDAERLRVIIDNLFTNALKFSPADGVITLRLYKNDGSVVFEIADEGPGVPHEEWTKVFTAYYQGTSRPERSYSGTGLGLAIAREYVLAAEGNIELCDAGKGACFRVTLPLHKESAATDNTRAST